MPQCSSYVVAADMNSVLRCVAILKRRVERTDGLWVSLSAR